ncbi:MAG: DMT family transporter [Rhodobacterales bacterium]|nr:DMT family transporter [Rhodobacterales bacterium]
MARRDRIDAAGAIALTGFAALLGFNQVVIKVVNEGLQPVFFAGLRSVIATACVAAWVLWRRGGLGHQPGTAGAGVLVGLVFAAEFLCLFLALDLTTVVRTAIIFYSMPVWLALMAHATLPGERITRTRALGLGLALAGTVWAILDQGSAPWGGTLAGDLCALGGAVGWAASAWMARGTALVRLRPETQLLWMVAVSGPILLAAAPAFGPLVRDLAAIHLLGLAFQGVIVVAAGFVFWLWLLSVYPASGVASFSFLTPVFGLAFGALILGEPVGPGIIGAAGLVALGIVLINRRPRS